MRLASSLGCALLTAGCIAWTTPVAHAATPVTTAVYHAPAGGVKATQVRWGRGTYRPYRGYYRRPYGAYYGNYRAYRPYYRGYSGYRPYGYRAYPYTYGYRAYPGGYYGGYYGRPGFVGFGVW